MHDILNQFYIKRFGVLQTWGEARPHLSLGNGGAQEYVKRPLTNVSAHTQALPIGAEARGFVLRVPRNAVLASPLGRLFVQGDGREKINPYWTLVNTQIAMYLHR